VRWTSGCFELAGFGFEVQVEDDAQRAAVVADIPTFQRSKAAPDIVATWQVQPLDLGPVEFVGEDGHRQFGRHANGLVVRHGAVTGFVNETTMALAGTSADPDALLDDYQTIFGSLMTRWLAYHNHFAIHAGAVARGQAALVLLGHPGAGKSTAAWGAHLAGFELLGDDTLFVRVNQGIEVSGMRKPVAIAGELLSEIPVGASQDRFTGEGGGSRDRWALVPEMLTPGWHRVVGVLTPAHGTNPGGELVKSEGSPLLPLAIGVYYAADDSEQLRAWFPHAAKLARLPAWELRHTPDVDRRLEVAAHWVNVAFDRALAAADGAPPSD
jgi:hypothetical protein